MFRQIADLREVYMKSTGICSFSAGSYSYSVARQINRRVDTGFQDETYVTKIFFRKPQSSYLSASFKNFLYYSFSNIFWQSCETNITLHCVIKICSINFDAITSNENCPTSRWPFSCGGRWSVWIRWKQYATLTMYDFFGTLGRCGWRWQACGHYLCRV